MRFILAALLVIVFVADSEAIGRRRRARCYTNYTAYNYNYTSYSSYGSPQAAAEAKASILANNGGGIWHPGGGYGGAYAEGVGSGFTAQQALNNCCFTGQRVVAGQCVMQGANGMFYACKTYW